MLTRLFGAKEFAFRCSECAEIHSGSPSYAHRLPSHYFDVPEDERDARVKVSDDLCQIKPANDKDDIAYFIRVVLEIPIKGATEPFMWGVWVSQSKESFDHYVESFDEDQSEEQSFGWLAVDLPFYKQSGEATYLESLECEVH